MVNATASILRCLVCQHELDVEATMYRCQNGHTFDRGRGGYVNLLLAGGQKQRPRGDSKLMVRSRHEFLSFGHYDGVVDMVVGLLSHAPASAGGRVLDVGCGEGYLLAGIAGRGAHTDVVGVDLSLPAIQLAARSYPDLAFAVGNAHDLPITADSVDCLLSTCAPYDAKEFDRVLARDGAVVVVRPGSRHLQELRELVVPTGGDVDHRQADLPHAGFRVVAEERCSVPLTISSHDQLASLYQMTPYYDENVVLPAQVERLTTQVDFRGALLVRNS